MIGTRASAAKAAASILDPMVAIALGLGPDPDQTGVEDGLGEVGVLGEKAIAGVHGVGAGVGAGGEEAFDRQIRLGERAGPIRTAWSASATNGAVASGSAYTATVSCPSRLAVRMTRRAISPRLAMRMRITPSPHIR